MNREDLTASSIFVALLYVKKADKRIRAPLMRL